jgi:hypothetical protein
MIGGSGKWSDQDESFGYLQGNENQKQFVEIRLKSQVCRWLTSSLLSAKKHLRLLIRQTMSLLNRKLHHKRQSKLNLTHLQS